jgi:predicted outer membrane protein
MQRTSLALTVAGILLAATTAFAAPSQVDKSFAISAAQSGLAEVQAGQLASQRATSPQVKQYGQKLVTDHTQANDQLQRPLRGREDCAADRDWTGSASSLIG